MPGTKTLHLPSSARTGGVALPKQADSEVRREQEQLAQELYEVSGRLEHYTRELQQIDPYLSVILAKPNTTVDGLRGGFYHIVRRPPGGPAYIKPHEDPITGAWRDLDGSIFQTVAEDDLWNDRTQRELRKRQQRAAEADKRDRDRASMDRAREFDERLWSRDNTSVRVTKDVK